MIFIKCERLRRDGFCKINSTKFYQIKEKVGVKDFQQGRYIVRCSFIDFYNEISNDIESYVDIKAYIK